MRSSDFLVLPLLALLLGCPGTDDDDDTTPFDCSLGVWNEDGSWEDLDGADVELIFGFQGFLWISVQVEADAGGPDFANILFSAEVGDDDPFGGSVPNVPFTAQDGARRSDEVQVRLDNDEGPEPFIGETLHLAIRGRAGARECTAEADMTLRDDDPCLHTDDEPVCPDDDDSADDDDSGR